MEHSNRHHEEDVVFIAQVLGFLILTAFIVGFLVTGFKNLFNHELLLSIVPFAGAAILLKLTHEYIKKVRA